MDPLWGQPSASHTGCPAGCSAPAEIPECPPLSPSGASPAPDFLELSLQFRALQFQALPIPQDDERSESACAPPGGLSSSTSQPLSCVALGQDTSSVDHLVGFSKEACDYRARVAASVRQWRPSQGFSHDAVVELVREAFGFAPWQERHVSGWTPDVPPPVPGFYAFENPASHGSVRRSSGRRRPMTSACSFSRVPVTRRVCAAFSTCRAAGSLGGCGTGVRPCARGAWFCGARTLRCEGPFLQPSMHCARAPGFVGSFCRCVVSAATLGTRWPMNWLTSTLMARHTAATIRQWACPTPW